ncbi:hypothetical protein BSKO_04270 [Bryopsis sp. KO-2023]|nr:hypothetical protein BSKO_04270 [Bryopsis sp. KO-2023]
MVTDSQTQSNFNEVSVAHSDFVLDVDFETKTIEGFAKIHLLVEAPNPKHVVLDTRKLTIIGVSIIGEKSSEATYKLEEEKNPILGAALTVDLPEGLKKGDKLVIGVHYRTSPETSAIQWLTPSQTAGKTHPYLFTQCQAIHARAVIPCQCTPAKKMSYSASVRVPQALTALMSAVGVDDPFDTPDFSLLREAQGPTRVCHWYQKIPIPPYLFALAVGDLVSKEIGPITKVWSEPSMVEAGAYEFAETNDYIKAGVSVAGEYVWGRYDLLLLPPSFPYGGMENPCLTFVTPTLLAGDRSLANTVAHEIAHSWTGNLVTSATWDHFWLNEGFTVFLERKILGRVFDESVLQMHAASGKLAMAETVRLKGEDHPHTKLVLDLSEGDDPDNAYSKIAYEKGFHFLYYLQGLVGGAEIFEPFLKAYIENFKLKVLATEEFKSFFLEYFKDNEAVKSIDWETWLYAPGMPPIDNEYDTSLAAAAENLAKKWHASDVLGVGGTGPEGASASDIDGWTSIQTRSFVETLAEFRAMKPLHPTVTRKLAELYNLDAAKNSEIRFTWCKLCLAAEDPVILDNVVSFLGEQGRMKFVRPLFKILFESKMGKDLALKAFDELKGGYHPTCVRMVGIDLGIEK